MKYDELKIKVSPLHATGDVDARAHIYIATALGRGRVAGPTLDRLYSRESILYSFYRRLSGQKSVLNINSKKIHNYEKWGEITQTPQGKTRLRKDEERERLCNTNARLRDLFMNNN